MKSCTKQLHQIPDTHKECSQCRKEYKKAWRAKNLERDLENKRQWKLNNPERHAEIQKVNNKKQAPNRRKWNKRKQQTDPLFKLKCLISVATYRATKGLKSSKLKDILGCDYQNLQTFLIQSAKRNYGGKYFPNRKYEIDHIVPLSSAKTEEELIKLSHYTNLQYLYKHRS